MCLPGMGSSPTGVAQPGMTQAELAAINASHGLSVGQAVSRNIGNIAGFYTNQGGGAPTAFDEAGAQKAVGADLSQWVLDNPERYKMGLEANRLDALRQAGKSTKQSARAPGGSPNPAAGPAAGVGLGGQQGGGSAGAAESFLGADSLLTTKKKTLLGL